MRQAGLCTGVLDLDLLRMRALMGVLPVIGGNPRRLVGVRMMLMRKVAIVMMFMFMFMGMGM